MTARVLLQSRAHGKDAVVKIARRSRLLSSFSAAQSSNCPLRQGRPTTQHKLPIYSPCCSQQRFFAADKGAKPPSASPFAGTATVAEGDDGPPPPTPPGYNDEPPEHVKKLVDDLLSLNVLEHVMFTKYYQRRLGISDEMLAAARGGGGGGGGGAAAAPVEEKPKEEKKEFDIKLVGYDAKSKIKVIKEVRTITGLGLKEAKDLVEGAPKIIKKAVKKEEAEALAAKLKELGAEIALE